MLKKAAFLPELLACTLALVFSASALAGDVKLVSDAWDSVCRVDITWGPGAPNGTPVEHYSDVSRNWSITKPDRLCYRRASAPDNCESGMTQWNTQWRCAAKADSGVEELSLQ
jgi:hypothetical protein